MRNLIIDRLVSLKNYEVRWNGGLVGAQKSLESQEKEYTDYLNTLEDNMLLDLLIEEERASATRQAEMIANE